AAVRLDKPIKTIGMFEVSIRLHAEVSVKVQVNVARSPEEAERQARLATMSENMRRIEAFKDELKARVEQLRGGKDRPNTQYHDKARGLAKAALEGDDWTAEEKRAAAEAIAEWLPKVVAVDMKDERKKLKLAILRGEA
ncbi:MAG: 50S ribosomal L9 C-terminal domain-containing protein, partial [Thiobacillus sp.]